MPFSYARFPATVQNLIGAILGNAKRLGFKGRFKVTIESDTSPPTYVLTLRVKDILNTLGPDEGSSERAQRNAKRR